MENHYETLGLNTSASVEEIRRAYRILARRYHPDVNPGKSAAEEKFKKIAEAYSILSDVEKKKKYDIDLERILSQDKFFGYQTFQNAQDRQQRARKRYQESQARAAQHAQQKPSPQQKQAAKPKGTPPPEIKPSFISAISDSLQKGLGKVIGTHSSESPRPKAKQHKMSVIEVSVSIRDAVYGVKKTVEISEPEGQRKISVAIPPGVRNGSVVHLRSKSPLVEELIIIVRLASHPHLSIQTRGLVAEIPITIQEAITGASISVPTLEDQVSIRIPPASTSGTEIRIPEKGLFQKEGTRGDLFIRLMIQVPQSPEAVGLKDKAKELDAYYETPVRANLPKSLLS